MAKFSAGIPDQPRARRRFSVCAALLLLTATHASDPVRSADPARTADAAWPGGYAARVAALAVLETLNAELLSHDSATLTLEHWCALHRLATPALIVAARVPGADKPASPEQRRELRVAPAEPLGYRRVRLRCGALVLSEADNWYVPARLTPEMNRLLDTTDEPFGKVVRELHFLRHTLSSRLLWQPLPEGWEMNADAGSGAAADLDLPAALLEHRALLYLPDGTPFSDLVETYTSNVLAFPPPRL
ncbi:MAG: hypothetical protein ACLQKH_13855 [Steroidobacteraceae bacterium]